MKYHFMAEYGSGYTVVGKMSEVLGVNRSGYYAYRKPAGKPAEPGKRTTAGTDPADLEPEPGAVRLAADHGRVSGPGAPLQGEPGGAADARGGNPVADEEGVQGGDEARWAGRGGGPGAAELPWDVPGRIWASDITYIWTKERWLYLAVVLDFYNREVVGWTLDLRIRQELILAALNQALLRHPPRRIWCSTRTEASSIEASG
jgi:transposase InsO family protein